MSTHLSRRSVARLAVHLIVALALAAVFGMPARAEDPPPATELIEGWVVDPAGKPVEGAIILAAPTLRTITKDDAKATQGKRPKRKVSEATTDAEGRFGIEVEGKAPFTLRAQAAGLAPTWMKELDPGEAGVITLTQGWVMGGRVLEKMTGAPIAGAEVECRPIYTHGLADKDHYEHFHLKTNTNESGEFSFKALDSNQFTIGVTAAGHSRAKHDRIEVGMSDSPVEPVYLYLLPAVDITGMVVDGEGAPLENAKVHVMPAELAPARMQRWSKGRFNGHSKEDGSFKIVGVPPEPSYMIEARHDEYALAWQAGVEPEENRSLTLRFVMVPGTEATGQLADNGEPYDGEAHASVSYLLPQGIHKPTVTIPSKDMPLEDGAFTLRHLPAGKAKLTIRVPGFTNITREEIEIDAEDTYELGELHLDPGLRIIGKILDTEGAPVAGASVEVRSFSAGSGGVRENAKSKEDGSFAIGGLSEGSYRLTAKAKSYGDSTAEDIEPGGDAVEVRMREAGRIKGRVLAGDPPEPLAGFSVEAKGKQDSGMPFPVPALADGGKRRNFTKKSGRFGLDGLTEGSYTLKIESNGFVTSRHEGVEVAAGETTEIGDVVLERGATLHGIVTEAGTGKPVAGAKVRIADSGIIDFGRFYPTDQQTALLTEPDGRFTLDGLAPGSIELKIEHERFSDATNRIDIVAGIPPAEASIQLSSGGAIEGTLRDGNGEPISGGIVTLMLGMVPSPDGTKTTDGQGRFRADHLTPGTYRVMGMERPGEGATMQSVMGQMKMATVEVVEGKTVTVNLPPDLAKMTIKGTVRRKGKPVAATMIWVKAAAGGGAIDDLATTSSDESGAYSLQLNSAGEYRVMLQIGADDAPGTNMPQLGIIVDVPDEPLVTHDIVIPDATVAGMVIDGDSGQPLAGVQVTAIEEKEDEPATMRMMVASARTDGEGRYELSGLADGSYLIGFVKEGFGFEEAGAIRLDDYEEEEGLNVSLLPATPFRLKVLADGGQPIESAMVSMLAMPVYSIGGLAAFTDQDGVAELTSLPDGTHDLGVITRGLAPRRLQAVVFSGDEQEMQSVTLSRGGALIVTVIDSEEQPVSDAVIRIDDDQGADLTELLQAILQMNGKTMTTGADGSLEIQNIESGRYEVEASWQDRTATGKVRVKASGANRLDLKLK